MDLLPTTMPILDGIFFQQLNQNLPNLFAYYIYRTQHFCNLLGDVDFLFYLLSILLQFFIFNKLDKNFKICFNYTFKRNIYKFFIF